MTAAQKFAAFHAANPAVYTLFKKFAFEAMAAGRTKLSSELIINRIRWETSITTTSDDFKINDHWKPYYARMFAIEFPSCADFFNFRVIRTL